MPTETMDDIIPMNAMEVGGALDAAVDEEQAATEAPPAKSTKQQIDDAERADARTRLFDRFCESIGQIDMAKSHLLNVAESHKEAKKSLESLIDFHLHLSKQLRELDKASKPDPARFPLFDKPEAIPPLPADTFPEYLRRKQNETPVSEMGLKKPTLKALADLKLETAGAIVRKFNAVTEGGARLTTIAGITEARLEEIGDALDELTKAATVEWEGFEEAAPAEEGGDDA